MEGLHFSTFYLRNKLSKGCINNNHPIIAQVMAGNVTNQGQVRVEIYPPAQSCWREIRGFPHKEMNLQIKSSYYDVLSKNDILPPWAIAFQPPNLMSSQHQIETIVSLRKTQAKDMLNTLSQMSTEEANQCKNRVDASTQALKAYYQQPRATHYNFNEALDALVTLTDRSQKLVHAEQQKKFLELSNKPSLALCMGFPEQLVPDDIKKSKVQPFLPPPGRGVNPDPPRGEESQSSKQEVRDPIRAPQEGEPANIKDQSHMAWIHSWNS